MRGWVARSCFPAVPLTDLYVRENSIEMNVASANLNPIYIIAGASTTQAPHSCNIYFFAYLRSSFISPTSAGVLGLLWLLCHRRQRFCALFRPRTVRHRRLRVLSSSPESGGAGQVLFGLRDMLYEDRRLPWRQPGGERQVDNLLHGPHPMDTRW